MGNFLCVVEAAKCFVNVSLHCNVRNLKKIRKISTFPPLEKFLRTSMAALTLSASFHVWANQAELTMYEIEN